MRFFTKNQGFLQKVRKSEVFLEKAAVELQEWLVAAYAKKCEREGVRLDGCSKADLVRSFRQKLKLNTQLAVASGLGGMLLTAGQPFGHDAV